MLKPFVLLVYCQLFPLLERVAQQEPVAEMRAAQPADTFSVADYTGYENPFLLCAGTGNSEW